jgi:D-sedoheptulose 7-phosphate isomerase
MGIEHDYLERLVAQRFAKSIRVAEAFFTAEAEPIAQVCWAMARRFHQGGRLLAFGNGAWATDAQHVSVEFVHPVIVGKRALPALALTNDSATMTGLFQKQEISLPAFARQLSFLARPQDIALGFSFHGSCANVLTALAEARQLGLLTLGLTGGEGGAMTRAHLDFCFVVPEQDPLVVQEIHETLYHLFWELVHVFFEHEGLLP